MKKTLKNIKEQNLIFIHKLLINSNNKGRELIWKPNSISFIPLCPSMPASSTLVWFFKKLNRQCFYIIALER